MESPAKYSSVAFDIRATWRMRSAPSVRCRRTPRS